MAGKILPGKIRFSEIPEDGTAFEEPLERTAVYRTHEKDWA